MYLVAVNVTDDKKCALFLYQAGQETQELFKLLPIQVMTVKPLLKTKSIFQAQEER